ncbi:biosynthetic peptidoglycan transglycosylase [Acuticoccus sp. MNP-M23]|uniref:biosynthetic peptidoglycan transglycosylase n=1 Tax=Acuticoccus sp. MNP-M23 TaxID=3072793 RepID=UPI00281614FB|nr:biosynthetic peptidoglycan transglycosylase [Acuticoccus sp. MNP-M23]WMS42894.1 biosynthetic peptidoglycan transglycosylase [Acuticoccus sp. MNP-M23]
MRRLFKIFITVTALIVSIPLVLTVLYAFVTPASLPVERLKWKGETVDQRWVALEDVAPELVRAVIMAEDARFCLHYGVDLRQMRIVIKDALDGEKARGASTITMQVVKTLFLWPDRNYLRKAVEVPLAFWMDLVLSKDRIIEIYLNVAHWGRGIYGVEAAAQRTFGVSAADVTRTQALALATVLPAPAARNPAKPGPRQRAVIAHVKRELDRAPWVFTCLSDRIRP